MTSRTDSEDHRSSGLSELAERIESDADERLRFMVAIAGPPGSGKSTVSEALAGLLASRRPASCGLVPMDGYHYDNAVLAARGLLARKGAPTTFDTGGLLADLQRIKTGSRDVAVPVFDRSADLARAAARIIESSLRIVLVEGNYLLLDDEAWAPISDLFDLTVFLQVDLAELERRLIRRWLDHGLDPTAARERALRNDIPNAQLTLARSRPAHIVLSDLEL